MRRSLRCLLLAALTTIAWPAGGDDSITLQVVRHRWHTGIVIPAERLAPALAFLKPHFSEPAYYEIGWGDNAFYREDNSTWLLIRAMLWPTDGVLHVVGLDRHPARLPHGEIQPVCVSARRLKALQQALAGDFVLDDKGRPARSDPGLYGDSRFFPAHGTFWFGHTCNTWTARRLRQAGLPTGRFTLSAGGVLDALDDQRPCPAP